MSHILNKLYCVVLEGKEQKCLDEISIVMKKYGII